MIFLLISKNKEWIQKEFNEIVTTYKLNDYIIEKYDILINDKLQIWNSLVNNDLFSNKKIIKIINYSKTKEFEELINNWNFEDKSKILIISADSKKEFLKLSNKCLTKIDNSKKNKYNQNLDKNDLEMFLTNNNIKITKEAYFYLLKNNFDLMDIKNEFLKLKDLNNITIKDIVNNCDLQNRDNIFALIEGLWKLNYSKLLKIYENNIINNYEPRQIFGLISNHFTLIYKIKTLLAMDKNENQISDVLKIHSYRLSKLLQKSNFISWQKINNIFKILLKYQIKINNFENDNMIVKILIFDISAAIV